MSHLVNTELLLPYGIVAAVGILALLWVHNLLTKQNDFKSFFSNKGVQLKYVSMSFGYAIALFGSLVMSHEPIKEDRLILVLDGAVALVVFLAAYRILDWAVLWKVNNADAIDKGNRAVAGVEACAYIALGLIIGASFSGSGLGMWEGLGSAALFSFVGLGTLAVIYWIYALGWQFRSSIDKEVTEGNTTAAIEAGSLLLGMGLVVSSAIIGDFTGWTSDLLLYAEAAVIGIVAVMAGRFVAGLKRPRSTRQAHHGNKAKSTLVATATLGVSIATSVLIFNLL